MKQSRNQQHRRRKLLNWSAAGIRRSLIFSALLACVANLLPAAQIHEVRAAAHPDFIRFVFEADSPTAADQPVLDSRQVVLLPLQNTNVRTELAGFWKPLSGVESIRFYQWRSVTVARISVTFDIGETRVMTLANPDRIVLDLFFDRQATKTGAEMGPAAPSDEPVRPSTELAAGASAKAAGVAYPDWLQEGGPGGYRGAILLLGGLLFLGIGAFLILSIQRSRFRSQWHPETAPGPAEPLDFDLIALDSMIKREMNRYERLSRLERPK